MTVNFTLVDKPAEGTLGSGPRGIPEGEQGGTAPSNPPDQSLAATPQPLLGTPKRVRISSGVAQGLLVTKVRTAISSGRQGINAFRERS